MKTKSLFISLYIAALSAALVHAGTMLATAPFDLAWWGVAVCISPGLLFFVRAYLAPMARTEAVLWPIFALNGIGTAMLLASGNHTAWPWFDVLVLGWTGNALYQFWYSRFGRVSSEALAVGRKLPTLRFESAEGRSVSTSDIDGSLLLIFYRGNWCPLCMAQIEEVALQYRALADRGIQTLLISSQPPDNTAKLAKKHKVPFKFLVDRNNRVARDIGILAENGTPTGLQALGYSSDTVMPTVVLTDRNKNIIFCDETDNYRVRPEPDVFLRLFDGVQDGAQHVA